MTSVFYDFGKSLSARCPYALDNDPQAANEFFKSAFRVFIEQFPNLRLHDGNFASQKIVCGNGQKPFLGFVQVQARNGFKGEYYKRQRAIKN